MYILTTILKATSVGIVRTPFLNEPFSIKGAAVAKKRLHDKKFTASKI